MEQWKTIEPNVWKPEKEGDSITGLLIGKDPADKEKNFSAKYHIENDQGVFLVWGSAVLDERMIAVDEGTMVRITFKEKKEIGKGRQLNIYKVEKQIKSAS